MRLSDTGRQRGRERGEEKEKEKENRGDDRKIVLAVPTHSFTGYSWIRLSVQRPYHSPTIDVTVTATEGVDHLSLSMSLSIAPPPVICNAL